MPWLSCIVSNVILALLLALAAWFIQRKLRWHAIAHILRVLVLVKLVTPPLVPASLLTKSAQELLFPSAARSGTRQWYTWVYWTGIGARPLQPNLPPPVDLESAQLRGTHHLHWLTR